MNRMKSLSLVVTIWMGLAIGASMAVYAAFEYFLVPGRTAAELIVEHLSHVVGLMIVIYVFSWGLFRRFFVRPLQAIHRHLYGVSAGCLKELEVETQIAELHGIVDSVNLMIRQTNFNLGNARPESVRRHVDETRELLKRLPSDYDNTAAAVMERVVDLEKALASVAQTTGSIYTARSPLAHSTL